MTTIVLSVLLGVLVAWYVTMSFYSGRLRRAERALEHTRDRELQARLIERDLRLIAALKDA